MNGLDSSRRWQCRHRAGLSRLEDSGNHAAASTGNITKINTFKTALTGTEVLDEPT